MRHYSASELLSAGINLRTTIGRNHYFSTIPQWRSGTTCTFRSSTIISFIPCVT